MLEFHKYNNRRLYCKSNSKYVSQLDVGRYLKDGEDVHIIRKHGSEYEEDVTKQILMQIIMDMYCTGTLKVSYGRLKEVIEKGRI